MSSHLSQILASPPSTHSLLSYSPLMHSSKNNRKKMFPASKGVSIQCSKQMETPPLSGIPIMSPTAGSKNTIRGRLRSASFAEKEGIIDEYQKGLIKDLVINGNDKLNKAMDAYQRGDISMLKDLIKSGYLNKQQIHKLDLLGDEELDIGFLNVGSKGQAMVPKDAVFSLDDVSFTSGSNDPLTPGQSFMHIGNESISLPTGIQYSPAMNAMHSPQPGLVLQYSPHLQPIQSYHSPGMHGISSNMFGFPDEFTNFNFEVNRSNMSQHSPLLPPQRKGGRSKATRKSRTANGGGARAKKTKRRASSTSNEKKTEKNAKKVGVKKMVGKYSPKSRRLRIERFLRKRKERVWTKRVKYDVRKNFADSRLRVKGRFVKKEDEEIVRDLMNMA